MLKITLRESLIRALCLFAVIAWTTAGFADAIVTIAGTGRDGYRGDGGPATSAEIGQPFGLTVGPDEALYVCSVPHHVIRRIDLANGLISTVAGNGSKGYSGDGGPAISAQLNEPYEIQFDLAGNMDFVEMQNQIVRCVDGRTKKIRTIAGTGRKGFSGDGGPAINATFSNPHSLALDASGGALVCDIGNHRIRRIDLRQGMIATFSGTGERKPTPEGAPIRSAALNGPRAIAFDGQQGLVLALREGNACLRFDLKEGRIHHLAGTGKKGYSGDGGDPHRARLNGPKGIAVSPAGDVYLADTENHVIRVIRGGRIETVVGDGVAGDGPDGDPRHCRLRRPHGVFVDSHGTLYIGDSENHRVRMLRRD